jgi:uncharacterized protein (TIGR03435 family)
LIHKGAVLKRSVLILLSCLACVQAESAFDVISIRQPAPYGQSDVSNPMLGDVMGATYRFPDRVRFRGITVLQLFQEAYGVKYFQVSGPAWIGTERFDIAATHGPNPSTEEFRMMLRTMLADRFGSKLHHETRDFTAYRLTVAKGGSKLGEPVAPGRGLRGTPVTGGFKYISEGDTIDRLVSLIELEFKIRGEHVPVTNETGLNGNFNFESTFAREDTSLTPSAYPTLFKALESDLGLHLEKGTAVLDMIVVDSVDRRPTEN